MDWSCVDYLQIVVLGWTIPLSCSNISNFEGKIFYIFYCQVCSNVRSKTLREVTFKLSSFLLDNVAMWTIWRIDSYWMDYTLENSQNGKCDCTFRPHYCSCQVLLNWHSLVKVQLLLQKFWSVIWLPMPLHSVDVWVTGGIWLVCFLSFSQGQHHKSLCCQNCIDCK